MIWQLLSCSIGAPGEGNCLQAVPLPFIVTVMLCFTARSFASLMLNPEKSGIVDTVDCGCKETLVKRPLLFEVFLSVVGGTVTFLATVVLLFRGAIFK